MSLLIARMRSLSEPDIPTGTTWLFTAPGKHSVILPATGTYKLEVVGGGGMGELRVQHGTFLFDYYSGGGGGFSTQQIPIAAGSIASISVGIGAVDPAWTSSASSISISSTTISAAGAIKDIGGSGSTYGINGQKALEPSSAIQGAGSGAVRAGVSFDLHAYGRGGGSSGNGVWIDATHGVARITYIGT